MGIYLLCSLGFVFYALIEFIILLTIEQRDMDQKASQSNGKKRRSKNISDEHHEFKRFKTLNSKVEQLKIETHSSDAHKTNESNEAAVEVRLAQKIDHRSFIGYFVAYGLFNFFYWIDMLFY